MKLCKVQEVQRALETLRGRHDAFLRLDAINAQEEICVSYNETRGDRPHRRYYFPPSVLVPSMRAHLMAQLDEAREVIRRHGFSDAEITEFERKYNAP